jgi:hypothetical protein
MMKLILFIVTASGANKGGDPTLTWQVVFDWLLMQDGRYDCGTLLLFSVPLH